MWNNDKNFPARGFSTPPPTWKSRPSPMTPMSERNRSSPVIKGDLFHVVHKVPVGDSPYVRAKHVQLIDKDPSRAISLFWAAINSWDRVDSALKDMAVVMKQLNRSDEAIEAIKSFRHLCPYDSQESLDNVLLELYKRSGRIEEEIEMLQRKLKHIEEGVAFGGKRTKIARSQGKKIQITIEQERSRILGNLAWAYLQLNNYKTAEELYRKALSLVPDMNKQCNLAICLMHMNRITEAKSLLQAVRASSGIKQMDDSYAKSFERAFEMLTELESKSVLEPVQQEDDNCTEVRRSFISLSNRNLKEITSSINETQDYVSGFMVTGRCTDGHDDEGIVLLNEQNSGNHREKDNLFGYDNGNLECISFRPGSSSQSSPQTMFVDKWKKGSYYKSPYEKRPGFASKGKENWVNMTGIEANSAFKSTYASPSPARNLELPFTQPRRCSWGFNNGDQRRGTWGENAVRSSNRKLSFESPTNTGNVWARTIRNLSGDPLASTDPNWVSTTRIDASSACKKPYASPALVRSSLEVPFTQPRRCSWGFKNGDQIRGTWEENVVGSTNGKLLFECPINTENARAQAINGDLLASTGEKSEVTLWKSETSTPSVISEDWGRKSWVDLTQAKDEAASSYLSQPTVNEEWKGTSLIKDGYGQVQNEAARESVSLHTVNGEWKNNSWENDGQKKFATKESYLIPKLPMEPPYAATSARAPETFIRGRMGQNSDVSVSGSARLTNAVEDKFSEKIHSGESGKTNEPISGNSQPAQEFLVNNSKKSWADMVEEDEEELPRGRTDALNESTSIETPSKCSNGWIIEEEYNDENLDSNIICQTHCPLNQNGNLSQKLESFDLEDGYCTSGNFILSRNGTVRRSLSFNQQQESEAADNFCSSALQKKALNLEGHNSVRANEGNSMPGKNIKPGRRNRLQVFRDITLLPESPRA